MSTHEFSVASTFSDAATFRAIGAAWKAAFEAVLTRAEVNRLAALQVRDEAENPMTVPNPSVAQE